MRVALVSPYSWTYPGGVTRHIEALALELGAQGHHVRVLAPVDRDTPRTARLHFGHRPAERPLPDWLVPLGGTVGLPANGAVSNVAVTPRALTTLRTTLAEGRFDVVHVHAPEAPIVGWDAIGTRGAALVGTFHSFNPRALTHRVTADVLGARRRFRHFHARIAVSEAAEWQMRRWYGGEYHVVPNGVHLPPAPPVPGTPGGPLELLFVGQPVERKGLPVLLRAFEALREHLPARLTIVGATPEEVEPLLLDGARADVVVLGKVDDAAKERALAAADVLCAPSLGGESFGMVLTEAFAHGTPVIASDIPGYRDVVRDGVDGRLVPRGDAVALARALRDLALDPATRARMAVHARERAERFAWPRVAAEVAAVYDEALAVPAPATARGRLAARAGLAAADGRPAVGPKKLAPLEPPAPAAPAGVARRRRIPRAARRAGLALAAAGGVALAVTAVDRIGPDEIASSLLASSPTWVLVALALMCASMVLRAEAWRAILRAALPDVRIRRSDAFQGTTIGVLMSATLPARLGEPARAFVVARRLGRAREHLPTVLGTIVSQTLLNILALVVLGVTTVSALDLFRGERALLGVTLAPVAVLLCVLVAPALLRASGATGGAAGVVRRAVTRVRDGLRVFRRPRLGAVALAGQLSAWALQWAACWILLVALGLDGTAGAGAAAAVLFAVNVTAVVPVTPSNVGIFQAACVLVLSRYGVSDASAIAYGVVLQALEVATAFVMGAPALIREGLSWRDVRLRALHATPVTLEPPAEPPGGLDPTRP